MAVYKICITGLALKNSKSRYGYKIKENEAPTKYSTVTNM